MTKNQLLALAAFITSLANDAEVTNTQPTPDPEVPKRRGRPPTTATPPAETPPPADTEKPTETPTLTGKTYEELQQIIKPLVVAGQGEDVKAVIRKYVGGDGGLKVLATLPQHHAAFEKDIAALSY